MEGLQGPERQSILLQGTESHTVEPPWGFGRAEPPQTECAGRFCPHPKGAASLRAHRSAAPQCYQRERLRQGLRKRLRQGLLPRTWTLLKT
eukprot:21634_2